jgi:hypothetical protein
MGVAQGEVSMTCHQRMSLSDANHAYLLKPQTPQCRPASCPMQSKWLQCWHDCRGIKTHNIVTMSARQHMPETSPSAGLSPACSSHT